MLGTVLRSHAGGYVVRPDRNDADLKCSARGRLKKEHVSILAGDRVELDDIDLLQGTANITSRLERKNVLVRPPLANVDQVIIVQAIKDPDWSPLWCDCHLVHFQLEVPAAAISLCFNKRDLASDEDIRALRSIYEQLGYVVIIVSAKTGKNLSLLAEHLDGKTSVFAGPSGVGKSSLLNALHSELELKVGDMRSDMARGRHTTTASQLYYLPISDNLTWVADTPGFGTNELRQAEPAQIASFFPELAEFVSGCRFTNCLHLSEHDCNVQLNIQRISPERFNSYRVLVDEALAEQKYRQAVSSKIESKVKVVGGTKTAKQIPRLSERYRAPSRRVEKQKLTVSKIHIDESDE